MITAESISDGQQLFELPGHPRGVTAVAFDRDGSRIASGGKEDKLIRIWDSATQSQIAELAGHRGQILSLTFSPDGSRLASGGRDGVLRLWDTVGFEVIAELEGHSNYIHSVNFSHDGQRIVTGSGDSTLRVWDSIPQRERQIEVAQAARMQAEMLPIIESMLQSNDLAQRLKSFVLAPTSMGINDMQRALLSQTPQATR